MEPCSIYKLDKEPEWFHDTEESFRKSLCNGEFEWLQKSWESVFAHDRVRGVDFEKCHHFYARHRDEETHRRWSNLAGVISIVEISFNIRWCVGCDPQGFEKCIDRHVHAMWRFKPQTLVPGANWRYIECCLYDLAPHYPENTCCWHEAQKAHGIEFNMDKDYLDRDHVQREQMREVGLE